MRIYITTVLFAILFFNSCIVSKKKYDAMTALKEKYRKDAANYQSDLKKTNADFEKFKYEADYNNSVKLDEIEKLYSQVLQLQKDSAEQEMEISGLRRNLGEEASEKQSSVNELKRLQNSILDLRNENERLRQSMAQSQQRYASARDELNSSQQQTNQSQGQIDELKRNIEVRQQTIKQLESQIFDYKQKLENISTNFIALRKKLLSAQSSGNPLDATKSDEIDKIARLLGHY